MESFIQQVINAVSLGGTYALVALGIALLFSIMNLINFAHGALMTLSAYVLFYGSIQASLPFGIAIVAAILGGAAAAVILERIAFRPLRSAGLVTLLLASFTLAVVIQTAFQAFLGARPKTLAFPDAWVGTMSIGGLQVATLKVITIAVTLVALAVLVIVLRKTIIGLAMRAAATDFPTTRLMGVNANHVFMAAFAISGALAAIAGILAAGQQGQVYPLMGQGSLLQGFIAAILGGLGTLSGPVAGGLVLGSLDVILQAYLPGALQEYRTAITLGIVVLILGVRPQGLIAPKYGQEPALQKAFNAMRRSWRRMRPSTKTADDVAG